MNILVSVNSKFLYPLKVLLFSLKETQSLPINLYLFNISLTPQELQELADYCRNLNLKLTVISLPKNFELILKSKASQLKQFKLSIETYSRLFAPYLLPQVDRILWLDADCLVQKDLKDFYTQDLNGKCIAACDQAYWDLPELSELTYPRKHHGECFNAGVILFDLNACRALSDFRPEKITVWVRAYSGEGFDQGILNKIFSGKVQWNNSLIYNMPINSEWDHGLHQHPIQYQLYKKAVILHYASPFKPWDNPCQLEPEKAKYWKAMEQKLIESGL